MSHKHESLEELVNNIESEYKIDSIDFSKNNKCINGPVVFVGQPEYFRSVYYDSLDSGHFHYAIKSSELSPLNNLPVFIQKHNIKTVIIFRPEWFASNQEAFRRIKNMGVTMIGYSTEPVPFDMCEDVHPDKLIRLKSLLNVLKLNYDVLVHFDKSSIEFLQQIGFSGIESHPLPVSKKIFYPEPDVLQRYDVCFLGRSTDYREKILTPLKCELNIVHVAHGLIDEDARTLMNQSKIVLNIHNHQYSNMEQRVATGLYCNKPVFSDLLSGGLYKENIDYVLYKDEWELYRKVKKFINDPWEIKPQIDLEIFNIKTFLRYLNINGTA